MQTRSCACGAAIRRGSRRCQLCYRAAMSERNRLNAPEQMRLRNPMRLQHVRELVSAKMKGRTPLRKAGNGHGPTPPQIMLANTLGWSMEVAIPTGVPKKLKLYPTCYKVDIGNAEEKVAIEIDGGSHRPLRRQLQDLKKDRFLVSLGWTVLRFSNEVVTQNLTACVQTVLSTTSKSKDCTPTQRMAS
jgi:hypothetical protein